MNLDYNRLPFEIITEARLDALVNSPETIDVKCAERENRDIVVGISPTRCEYIGAIAAVAMCLTGIGLLALASSTVRNFLYEVLYKNKRVKLYHVQEEPVNALSEQINTAANGVFAPTPLPPELRPPAAFSQPPEPTHEVVVHVIPPPPQVNPETDVKQDAAKTSQGTTALQAVAPAAPVAPPVAPPPAATQEVNRQLDEKVAAAEVPIPPAPKDLAEAINVIDKLTTSILHTCSELSMDTKIALTHTDSFQPNLDYLHRNIKSFCRDSIEINKLLSDMFLRHIFDFTEANHAATAERLMDLFIAESIQPMLRQNILIDKCRIPSLEFRLPPTDVSPGAYQYVLTISGLMLGMFTNRRNLECLQTLGNHISLVGLQGFAEPFRGEQDSRYNLVFKIERVLQLVKQKVDNLAKLHKA